MNILFIDEYDWFHPIVFDIHIFSEGLSLLGHQVYAIDNGWDTNSRVRLKAIEIRDVARVYPAARVHLSHPGFINFMGLRTLSTAFTHYLEIGKAIRDRNIDAIMLYHVYTNGLQAVHLAKKFNIPLVFRSMDILHNLMPTPMKHRATKFLEKWVYSRADAVLPISPGYSEYVRNMGAPESKVKLLLFPIDIELYHPSADGSELRQQWGLGEKDKIIAFIGVLYEFSGLGAFIQQFPEVVRQIPEAKLLIVGDGPLRPQLEESITELGLQKQVIITGMQPYQTIPQYINLAAICINPFPVTDATRYLFSGKMIQYLACGKATIASPLPGMTTLIPGESQGIVYANSAIDMAREAVHLLKSTERREQLEQAGLNYVRQTHSFDKVTRQLETILVEVIKEKRDGATSKRVQR